MPESMVQGRLYNQGIPDWIIQEVVKYLAEKGYDHVSTTQDNGAIAVSFIRYARLESVVNELVPEIEQLGFDTWQDLELLGYEGQHAVSSYRRGRITREY